MTDKTALETFFDTVNPSPVQGAASDPVKAAIAKWDSMADAKMPEAAASATADVLAKAFANNDAYAEREAKANQAFAASATDQGARIKRWPFVETPGEFTERLAAAVTTFDGDLLAAVRNVLIESPPALAERAQAAQPVKHGYKDCNVRQVVDDLCAIAIKYHATAHLHARISGAVSQFIATPAPEQEENLAPGLDDEWTKIRYSGSTYSFPGKTPLPEVFGDVLKLLSLEPAPEQEAAPFDKGPWRYVHDPKATEHVHRYFVESADFSHDVRLYVNGDFSDDEQHAIYGKALAAKLNGDQEAAQVVAKADDLSHVAKDTK